MEEAGAENAASLRCERPVLSVCQNSASYDLSCGLGSWSGLRSASKDGWPLGFLHESRAGLWPRSRQMLGLLLSPHLDGLSPPTEAWRVVTVWGPCELRALPSQMALREVPQ